VSERGIIPSWQDVADRWMAAYEEAKAERDAARADAERLAAALHRMDESGRYLTPAVRRALAAHDALTGDAG